MQKISTEIKVISSGRQPSLYLHEYADYLIALERQRDKDDLILSADEMRKRLGISH